METEEGDRKDGHDRRRDEMRERDDEEITKSLRGEWSGRRVSQSASCKRRSIRHESARLVFFQRSCIRRVGRLCY